jgi:hypothetical protein
MMTKAEPAFQLEIPLAPVAFQTGKMEVADAIKDALLLNSDAKCNTSAL